MKMNTLLTGVALSLLLGTDPVHSTFTRFMDDDDWVRENGTPYEQSLLNVKPVEKALEQEGDFEWSETLKKHRLEAAKGSNTLLCKSLIELYRVYRDERPKEVKGKIHPLIKKASEYSFINFEKLDHFDSLYQKGVNFRKANALSEARQCFEQVLSSPEEETRIKALHNLGSVSYSLNQVDNALQYFLKATILHQELEGVDFVPSRNNINKIKGILATQAEQKNKEAKIPFTYQSQRGDLKKLPVNVIRFEIAPYLRAESLIGINKFFYSLVTGLDQVGMKGVQNEPSVARPLSIWSHLKLSRSLPSYEDQAIIPSSIWFNVVKEIDLNADNLLYFQHLKNTNIQTIRLMPTIKGHQRGYMRSVPFEDRIAVDAETLINNLPNQLTSLHIEPGQLSYFDLAEGIGQSGHFALLSKLIHLRSLNVSQNDLGDQGLSLLVPLINLEVLDISGNGLSIKGMPYVSHFKNLHTLDISRNFDNERNPLGNEAIGYLSPLTNLQTLHANRLGINDDVIDYLKNLKALEFVSFMETGITDQMIPQLIELKQTELKRLHTINTMMTSVSYEGQKRLNDAGYKTR